MSSPTTSAPPDPRKTRLINDWNHLKKVNTQSDYVRIHPVASPDGVPERYIVKFFCRGIVGIDNSTLNPIYADEHEVEIYCDSGYPHEVPKLRWVTPIWHPNIEHAPPKQVCVNKKQWLAGLTLLHLCWQMFDMVQYRNYHAEHTDPYPLDPDAAKWVRDVAEPRQIVNLKRRKYVDDKPFYRPDVAPGVVPEPEQEPRPHTPRVRFVERSDARPRPAQSDSGPAPRPHVRFVRGS
jgi:ubiquitin-protein ligase